MKVVGARMEKSYFDLIDQLVGENKIFPTRSELGRQAIREKIIKENLKLKSKEQGNAEE